MKDGKMTEKEIAVFNYVKSNGGRVSIDEIAEALERSPRSIGPNINAFVSNDLAVREKVEVEGAEKPVTYVVLTDAGMNFVPATDEE
jgi:DNA-binding MarR family transcriptional regulator